MPNQLLPPIILSDICLSYDKKCVFNSLSMEFSPQGISFLVGENGAGKTQLLRLIHGLVKADSGFLVAPKKSQQGYLQQVPTLLNRSVKDNLYYVRGSKVCPKPHFDKMVHKVISHFQLHKLLYMQVGHLSGGQRKRVAIARLFLQRCDYYLLDEPSTSLDHQQNLLVEAKLNKVLAAGKKIIMSSHDYFQLERLFMPNRDEIWIMKDGDILEKAKKLNGEQLKRFV